MRLRARDRSTQIGPTQNLSRARFDVVSRVRPFRKANVESMSHPALAGARLFLREQTRSNRGIIKQ